MGRKNRKSRRRDDDDDDLLGPPSPPSAPPDDAPSPPRDGAPDAGAAIDAAAQRSGKGGAAPKPKGDVVDVDPARVEAAMADALRGSDGNRSEDWLVRTVEKNLRLPKHSLRRSVAPDVLGEMIARVEEVLDREAAEEAGRRERWDVLVEGVTRGKAELGAEDEARLREGARAMGIDADEAVAAVAESIREAAKKKKDGEAAEGGDGSDPDCERTPGDSDGFDAENASLSVSILLALQPRPDRSAPQSILGRPFSVLRQLVCTVLFATLSLLLGRKARADADRLYERLHLPAIKAAQLDKEREEDLRMLKSNTHLWSDERNCWMEKDATYASATDPTPPTIRWNEAQRRWERWSKNLKTRTKAMKLAEAAGVSPPAFLRGTFVPVRAGEGWASAPGQPEEEKERISVGNVRFFVCLPATTTDGADGGRSLEVADVTSWATGTLLTKEAARELEAVDSGRELFSLDVSTLLPNGKGGRKGTTKSRKKKKQGKDETGQEEGAGNSVAGKGVGRTARVSERYLDKL